MISVIKTAGISGIDGYAVTVECDLSNGLPAFDIVGLPDTTVKESRNRVRSAIKNCGFDFPLKRITVNLAPADLKKEGSVFDLPILFGILKASNQITEINEDTSFIGELSLEGALRPVPGVLPMAAALSCASVKTLFVPAENAREASVAKGINIYPANNVKEIIAHLTGEKKIMAEPEFLLKPVQKSGLDFSDVLGQENVKRALEIAAAGGHNILLVGPPGSGKSMLSKRITSILPDMTYEESIVSSKIHSVSGLLKNGEPLLSSRPFRSPHHTVSAVGLSGGGRAPRPGEISLAHNGVLFLDELPEFSKDALEVLRQPLEDGVITITRASGTCVYPSSFMLVCAMNPCKCGWYGHPSGRCRCAPQAVKNYISKISGPLLDRIDIHVDVPSVRFEDLSKRTASESSAVIRQRVNRARKLQTERYKGTGVNCNSRLLPGMMKKYCPLDNEGGIIMKQAFDSLGFTARAYDRVLKVARTIADLEGEEFIKAQHVAEAVQYRSLDRLF